MDVMRWRIARIMAAIVVWGWSGVGAADREKTRLLVVHSYHREFLWNAYTHKGFVDGLLKFGYLDDAAQAERLLREDELESSNAIIKCLWMDTKRKSAKPQMTETAIRFVDEIKAFKPDLLLLGDDNAANYIGSEFLDTDLPIVLWGINSTLVKYGLVDSMERPGHNVTGVVEVNYFAESLQLLKRLVPQARTFGILADDTDTGRVQARAAEYLAQQGGLPLQLVETVMTADFEQWKRKALELQSRVDAFLVLSNTANDPGGHYIPDEQVVRWYIEHIHIPEATRSRRLVQLGLLCAADGSGEAQGFEGVRIAHDILAGGKHPATYPPVIPKRGPLLVNRTRAQQLGITLTQHMGIEEYLGSSQSLSTKTEIKS